MGDKSDSDKKIHVSNMTARTLHVQLTVRDGTLHITVSSGRSDKSQQLQPLDVLVAPMTTPIGTCIQDGKLSYVVRNLSNGPLVLQPLTVPGPDGGPLFALMDEES